MTQSEIRRKCFINYEIGYDNMQRIDCVELVNFSGKFVTV